MGETFTTEELIRCAGRELGLRRSTYPKWVRVGRLTQEAADREIALMDAIYARLKELRSKEEGR
jgi:hypothetical protein